jgi:hypothetical protein
MHDSASWSCTLQAVGTVRATADMLPALRKRPGPATSPQVTANLLNHADDQTVVGVSAVLHAIADLQPAVTTFQDWGVVGSPRFPGRVVFDSALEKFGRLGPLSVSPLLVPFQSQHALSSMISLVLRIHGPAVGAGGGCDGLGQALLSGLSLLHDNSVPGVWVAMTCWEPEPFSAAVLAGKAQPVCHAAALALRPAAAAVPTAGSRLRMMPGTGDCPSTGLPDLVRYLADDSTAAPAWRCAVAGGYELEITRENAAASPSPFAKSA